jgi:hypothetical protein
MDEIKLTPSWLDVERVYRTSAGACLIIEMRYSMVHIVDFELDDNASGNMVKGSLVPRPGDSAETLRRPKVLELSQRLEPHSEGILEPKTALVTN